MKYVKPVPLRRLPDMRRLILHFCLEIEDAGNATIPWEEQPFVAAMVDILTAARDLEWVAKNLDEEAAALAPGLAPGEYLAL